jgi:chromosome segregation ATPase
MFDFLVFKFKIRKINKMQDNSFFETRDEAIPLITYDTKTRLFTINPNAESILRALDSPLGIVSVAGMYRTGKSYLLNRLLLNRASGFSVGPTINPCTKGLWIWPKPVSGYSSDGSPINVLIIDTEGIGATDEDQNHDSKIFTLGILLSSYFLFNSLGSIDENAIQNLSFIVNITKNVQVNSSSNEVDPREIAKYLPSFMWVIRDFSLRLVDPDGEPITSKEYLEKSLEIQKGFSDIIEQKNKIRVMLKEFFKERDCATLVRPLTDEHNLQNLAKMELNSLRPEFVDQINQLRKKVLHKVKPKVLNGKALNGEMFCNLMHNYVEAINRGAVPVIENAWSFLCKNECGRAVGNAINNYDKSMNAKFVCKMPIDEDELKKLHKEVKAESLKLFKQQAIDGVYYEQFVNELKSTLKEKLLNHVRNNDKETKKLCQTFLNKNYVKIENKLKQGVYKYFAEYKADIDAFILFYQENCPQGPNRNLYLYEFILANTLEASDLFIRSSLSEYDSMSTVNNEKITKLQNELNEIKNELTKEIQKRTELTKIYESEKTKYNTNESFNKEALMNIQKDKEKIHKELNEQMDQIRKDYERQLIELRGSLYTNESNAKEFERRMLNSESEFEKQKVLLEQKIKFLEKNVEDLSKKERDLLSETSNLRRETLNTNKDNAEKYESQLRALCQKNDTLQDQIFELESKLIEKEKKLENEKVKSDSIITDLKTKVDELNSFSKKSQMEIQTLNDKNMGVCENIKAEFERKIQDLKNLNEMLENKSRETDENYATLRNTTSKEIATLKQKLEFAELQLREIKVQYNDEKSSNERIKTLLQDNYNTVFNEKEELATQLQDTKAYFENELMRMETDYQKNKLNLSLTVDSLNQKLSDVTNKFNELGSTKEKILNSLNERDEEIARLKVYYQSLTQGHEYEINNLLDEHKLRLDNLNKANHERLEDALRTCRLDMEQNNLKNERIVAEIRRNYETERTKFENDLNREKERINSALIEQENYFKDRIKELERIKDERIVELEDELENLENNHNNYVSQTEQDLNLNAQQIDNLTKFLSDTKDSLNAANQSHALALAQQYERFDSEKKDLCQKLEELSLDLNKKEKEIMLLTVKKEQLEESYREKQEALERIRAQFEIEKKELNEKMNAHIQKNQSLNDELWSNKVVYDRTLALKEQEIEFDLKKIGELQAQIDDINRNYDERVQLAKEQLRREYEEQFNQLKKERDDYENKFIEKRRELKDSEAVFHKEKNMLEREKAVLTEKLQTVNKYKEEILESLEKEREAFTNKINDIVETNRRENETRHKEFEFLKSKYKELQKNFNEVDSNYSREKDLWESKFEFLEEQRNQARADLTELQKKFELTIDGLQRKGLVDKDRIETSSKAMFTMAEERYKNQIRDLTDNFHKNLEELKQTIRLLEEENRSLWDKLTNKGDKKQSDIKELTRLLALAHESENRLKNDLAKANEEHKHKAVKLGEAHQEEIKYYKDRTIELENKVWEYEMKRNAITTGNAVDKVSHDKEKEALVKEAEQVKEILIGTDRKYKNLLLDYQNLLRDHERCKSSRGRSNNGSFIIPRYNKYGTVGKENHNRNNSNSSFDNDGIEILNFNTTHKPSLIPKLSSSTTRSNAEEEIL